MRLRDRTVIVTGASKGAYATTKSAFAAISDAQRLQLAD